VTIGVINPFSKPLIKQSINQSINQPIKDKKDEINER